jgi:hypothetical protein
VENFYPAWTGVLPCYAKIIEHFLDAENSDDQIGQLIIALSFTNCKHSNPND